MRAVSLVNWVVSGNGENQMEGANGRESADAKRIPYVSPNQEKESVKAAKIHLAEKASFMADYFEGSISGKNFLSFVGSNIAQDSIFLGTEDLKVPTCLLYSSLRVVETTCHFCALVSTIDQKSIQLLYPLCYTDVQACHFASLEGLHELAMAMQPDFGLRSRRISSNSSCFDRKGLFWL